MNLSKINIVIVCSMFLFIMNKNCLYAQNGVAYNVYLKHMQNIFTNCSMDYKMDCIYPDSMKLKIIGRVAVQGSNYYDSSNVRYLFLNKSWYISADHESKNITVNYLPKLNEYFEGIGQVNFVSFLYNDYNFLDRLRIIVSNQNADTMWADFKIIGGDSKVELFKIKFLKSTMMPIEYRAIINFPLDEEDDALTVHIDYVCTHITYPVPETLFDDSRLINYTDNKAILKRFNNYKSTFNNNPKNNSNEKK